MSVFITLFGYPLTYIEFFAVLLYFISVYFAIKINIWTWPVGIISQILFFILYLDAHTYANAFLQIIFILLCIKGWIRWHKKDTDEISTQSYLTSRWTFIISFLSIILFGTILKYYSNDPYPYYDVAIFVWSVVGTVLLTYKKLQAWVYWIVVNITSLILYSNIGYYFVAIQGLIFIFMDSYALNKWIKLWKSKV